MDDQFVSNEELDGHYLWGMCEEQDVVSPTTSTDGFGHNRITHISCCPCGSKPTNLFDNVNVDDIVTRNHKEDKHRYFDELSWLPTHLVLQKPQGFRESMEPLRRLLVEILGSENCFEVLVALAGKQIFYTELGRHLHCDSKTVRRHEQMLHDFIRCNLETM